MRALVLGLTTAIGIALAGCGELGTDNQETQICYEYECSNDTGRKCFTSMSDYCDSVCGELDTCAMNDCEQNCP